MEGLEYDYINTWGLNSINAYDQYGFSYCFQLRPGGTYSANGAGTMIRNIFKQVEKNMNKFLRGDSAYCNIGVMNTCINQNAKFTLAMKENVYKHILRLNQNTMKRKKTNPNFFDCDQCELSNAIYPNKDLAGRLNFLRVVFIRASKVNTSEIEDTLD
ncbi:MAG: transposase [Halobacteriovoraceae bacterium]|nr:transposase [Halobacteriovoraceae bacterium]